MSGIHDQIRAIMRESPEMRGLMNQLLPTLGVISYCDEETNRVSISYNDPINGSVVTMDDVDLSRMGNMHGTIEVDDRVLLIFLGGSSNFPLVAAVIPKDQHKDKIAGSYTTKISGGI